MAPLLLFSPQNWDALEEGAPAFLAEGSEALLIEGRRTAEMD
jgi:hypothetical protein